MAGRTLITQDQLADGIKTSQLEDGAEFIQKDGSVAMEATLNMGDNSIQNVNDPVNPKDVVNKQYLESRIPNPIPGFLHEGDAKTIGGLVAGDIYFLLPNSDVGPAGTLMVVVS